MGKLAPTLPIVAVPRLQGSVAAATDSFTQVQAAMNDDARSVVGVRRDDPLRVETLLESARYISANQLAVKATGMAAWMAFKGDDGGERYS
jgi:hypothetical protein